MCASCGCSESNEITITDMRTGRHIHLHGGDDNHHVHGHSHDGGYTHSHGRTVTLEHELLSRNKQLAERNRGWFAGRNILAINLMSSPGAGKTTLLERTIREGGGGLGIHVIEGDQETLNDAERIRATGAPVVQVNTGAACHLDAEMVSAALRELDPPSGSSVLIENVGNLVCPALFDLGEAARVVVASVTDGEDKPAKYPHIFRAADAILLNKMDLLPHVEFSMDCFSGRAEELKNDIRIFPVSATRGDGLQEWYAWLRRLRNQPLR